MQLVVEGIENLRRIISVGTDSTVYPLKQDQEIRMIDSADWQGWRKSEIHWDEEKQTIIESPFPASPEEKEAKRVEKVKARFDAELFGLVYANKDNSAALAVAMCDRVKEIDAETTIEPTPVKELER